MGNCAPNGADTGLSDEHKVLIQKSEQESKSLRAKVKQLERENQRLASSNTGNSDLTELTKENKDLFNKMQEQEKEIQDLQIQLAQEKQNAAKKSEISKLNSQVHQLETELKKSNEDRDNFEMEVMKLQKQNSAQKLLEPETKSEVKEEDEEHPAEKRIELHIQCNDLPNEDTGSLTDAFVVAYLSTGDGYEEVMRTDIVFDNLDPEFVTTMLIPVLAKDQNLRFWVYHAAKPGDVRLSSQHKIGYCDMDVRTIMNKAKSGLQHGGQLKDKKERLIEHKKTKRPARLKVWVELVNVKEFLEQESYVFDLQCKNLPKSGGMFNKLQPRLEIYRKVKKWNDSRIGDIEIEKNETVNWIKVYQSDVAVAGGANPVFNTFALSTYKLCYNDLDNPIVMKVFDNQKSKANELIGAINTNLRELKQAKTFILKNVIKDREEKKKNKGKDDSKEKENPAKYGVMHVTHAIGVGKNKNVVSDSGMMTFMHGIELDVEKQKYFESSSAPDRWVKIKDHNGYVFFRDDNWEIQYTSMFMYDKNVAQTPTFGGHNLESMSQSHSNKNIQ